MAAYQYSWTDQEYMLHRESTLRCSVFFVFVDYRVSKKCLSTARLVYLCALPAEMTEEPEEEPEDEGEEEEEEEDGDDEEEEEEARKVRDRWHNNGYSYPPKTSMARRLKTTGTLVAVVYSTKYDIDKFRISLLFYHLLPLLRFCEALKVAKLP